MLSNLTKTQLNILEALINGQKVNTRSQSYGAAHEAYTWIKQQLTTTTPAIATPAAPPAPAMPKPMPKPLCDLDNW